MSSSSNLNNPFFEWLPIPRPGRHGPSQALLDSWPSSTPALYGVGLRFIGWSCSELFKHVLTSTRGSFQESGLIHQNHI